MKDKSQHSQRRWKNIPEEGGWADMTKVPIIMTLVDVITTLSNLWDDSTNSIFLDSSELGCLACSITFLKDNERATIGIVYTENGGAARIFDGQMKVVAQTLEKISQEDFYGVYVLMLRIQKELPVPAGVGRNLLQFRISGQNS
jgi:hypothetical protein